MFEYATRELGYSESAAGRRIACARAITRFPLALLLLESGEITFCSLSMIASSLTETNAEAILTQLRGKNLRETEYLKAQHQSPTSPVRERVTPVRVKPPAPLGEERVRVAGPPESLPVRNPDEPAMLYKISFLADDQWMQAVNTLKDLVSNAIPAPSLEAALKHAVDFYIETHHPKQRQARRESRTTEVKSEPKGEATSRHIPAAIADQVFVRDQGQCTYVSPGGVRCRAKSNLEIDHEIPFAMGGPSSLENLRLLCRAHNALHAQKQFGAEFIAKKIESRRRKLGARKGLLPLWERGLILTSAGGGSL
jgi:5-methylcytosine-specific restriction endonuclease McrA